MSNFKPPVRAAGSVPSDVKPATNFVNNEFVQREGGTWVDVTDPATAAVCGKVMDSTADEVKAVVDAAQAAFPAWSSMTMKARAAIMLRFHALINKNAEELAQLVVLENGKNIVEARADIAKGNETVEWACSLPQIAQGRILEVSTGISCRDERVPLGVVACIVPFNFPFMVPMWTTPIALVMGNCVVLKPSEKVPFTMRRVCELMIEAGFPKGVFSTVNGTAGVVNALIQSPTIKAVSFVGSAPIAEIVATECHKIHKRVLALGGAKNHLVALPDALVDQTATDVVASYAGCCGQRCMAASVLLLVDPDNSSKALLDKIVEISAGLQPGQEKGQVGPCIDERSAEKIMRYINDSDSKYDSQILLDGRPWRTKCEKGHWVGPTIIQVNYSPDKTNDPSMFDEIFGPVLCVIKVKTIEEALAIENANPFGNAACVYTRNGGFADQLVPKFRAAMIGVNIGIPVPREPFSFGGLYGTFSKYGDGDITGDGAMEFFSTRRKVTTRWGESASTAFAVKKNEDVASFSGKM